VCRCWALLPESAGFVVSNDKLGFFGVHRDFAHAGVTWPLFFMLRFSWLKYLGFLAGDF
jgi:hypothetical protein